MRRTVDPAVVIAIALALTVMTSSDSPAGVFAPYSVDFHTVSSGGNVLRNSCFTLTGTVGQVAPGYSSTTSGAPAYSVNAGFWPAAPGTIPDEIFFAGYEDC